MLVNKIEVAKDTVHQFTNQVITVSDTITHSSRDYITRDEVINLFDVSQTLFNNQTTIMLTVFAIGIAILGIMIPLWQKKNLKDTERRLDKDSKSNENRVNRELDQYRLDINEFKKNIDGRIENNILKKFDEYNILVKEKTKELESKINQDIAKVKSELKNLKYENEFSGWMMQSYISTSNNKYHSTFYHLLEAAKVASEHRIDKKLNVVLFHFKILLRTLEEIGNNQTETIDNDYYDYLLAEIINYSKYDEKVLAIAYDIETITKKIYKKFS